MKVTAELRRQQREYYALCDKARELGIPTSLDNPRSPRTVSGLKYQISLRESWKVAR